MEDDLIDELLPEEEGTTEEPQKKYASIAELISQSFAQPLYFFTVETPGPTKKASSTSKGKKWKKCVKSDSGGYKRIHWGQKGVKVSGKANTKRRKSFRARHKCSTAKSNTPRGQACKDW